MALKHLMEMTKADRYTADGCEALNKAREADVEDRTYKTGEISEKTGLQKQPDGSWAPPKKGGLGSGTGKKETENKAQLAKEIVKALEERKSKPVEHFTETKEDRQKKAQEIVRLLNERSKQKAESKPDFADQRDQIGGEIKGNLEAAKYYFDKAQSFSTTDPSYKTYMLKAKEYNDMAKNQADDYGFEWEEMHNSGITTAVNNYAKEQSKTTEEKPERYNYRAALERGPRDAFAFEGTVTHSIPMSAEDKEQLANIKSFMKEENTDYKDAIKSVATGLVNGNKLHGDWYPEREESVLKIAKAVGLEDELKNYIAANHKGYDFGYSEDAAPRLTGDTRLRLSQVKDKVYQIGEISQKTGLQKTANGWVKPKTGKAERQAKIESIGRDEKLNKVRQVLNTALTPSGDKVQMTKSKVTGDFHVLLNGKSTGGGFRDPQKAKEEFNAWIAGKKAPSESAKERINKRFDESEARSQKAMESKPVASTTGNWKEASMGLVNQAGVSESLSNIAFNMTPAWAKEHGYSPDDVNGTAAQNKMVEKIIRNQDWSKPEDAVKKINALNFGYTNWKVIEKQADKVKIASEDSLGNISNLTIRRAQSAGDAAPRQLTGNCKIRVRK